MSIDWSKAPEGTTHYHIGEDINPWRKIEGTVAYEHYRGKWLRVNSFNEGCMPGYYVPIPQETWDGQGLPPVGTNCEYRSNDGWLQCEVVAHRNNAAVVLNHHYEADFVPPQDLRPLLTPEQIAAEEREAGISDMQTITDGAGPTVYAKLSALYDAGYRRQESST